MKSIFIFLLLYSGVLLSQNRSVERLRDLNDKSFVAVAQHRGMWQYAPENSIPALEYAIQFGADILEIDIRLTKDHIPVVIHDLTLDRTTNGTGKVADFTLEEIKKLRLKEATGGLTDYQIPTLEEFIQLAKGRIILYYDKAGYDLPQHEKGFLAKTILQVAKKHDFLQESLFVLNWTYTDAKKIFNSDLEKVIYCPVIEDKIPHLEVYVEEFLQKLKPIAFQFRFDSLQTRTYGLLPKVLKHGSRAFVAATWKHHTAHHDDMISILKNPEQGWGWLVQQGFSVLETNYLRELDFYLKSQNRR